MEKRPKLYILTGIPFAGKTTLGKEIAKRVPIQIIEINAMVEEKGWVGRDLGGIEFEELHSHAQKKTKEILLTGASCIYDAALLPDRVAEVRNLGVSLGVEPMLIFVNIEVSEALRRSMVNSQTHERMPVHPNNFNYVIKHFKPPDNSENYVEFHAGQNVNVWIKTNIVSNY